MPDRTKEQEILRDCITGLDNMIQRVPDEGQKLRDIILLLRLCLEPGIGEMKPVHHYYLQLSDTEKEQVGQAYDQLSQTLCKVGLPIAGDLRAECVVEAIAVGIQSSRGLFQRKPKTER